MVLLTIVTMLNILSSNQIHLVHESLYPFVNLSLFLPPCRPWQPPFYSLFLRVQLFFFFNILHISEIMQYLSLSGLFHLAWCLPGSSMLLQMAGFPSFLKKIYLFNLFIFGCVGSSLLCEGFL